jgi:hypothetical protein
MTAVGATVEWIANSKYQLGMPPQVVLFVAAIVVSSGHFLVNVFNAFIGTDDPKFAAALKSESVTLPTTVTTE